MLTPKRTKYRKYHRGRMRGTKTRGNEICFGNFGLQALEPSWITSRQIEAAESRMGSGKGAVDYWVAVVKPGTILFEIGRVPQEVAQAAFKLASYKLPIKTKFIIRDNI